MHWDVSSECEFPLHLETAEDLELMSDTAAPGGDSELGFLANEKGVTDTCRGVHMHER